MAVELVLSENLFAQITPAGAYYAAASPVEDTNRQTLFKVLGEGSGTPLNDDMVLNWTGADSLEVGLRTLFRLQRLGLIRGQEEPNPLPEDRLEDILPKLLNRLSEEGKAVLADDNGFYLAAAGFTHEASEELAGLAGDILSLQERHGRLLKNNLKQNTDAWGLIDPSGRSQLGFWPLFLGAQVFVLIIGGTPRLQNQEFVTLIHSLAKRYAGT